MTDRYFVGSPITGGMALLAGPEAHHLIHVMRAKPGDQVMLFDGSGAEFHARIERVERAEVELAVLARHEVDRELPLDLTLSVTFPKGDRQKWLVEKAVELGVGRLVPLLTARSVARPNERTVARLGRTVIEASKQCGRNRLMEIAAPQRWPDFVTATWSVPSRLLAHPNEQASETRQPAPSSLLERAGRSKVVILAVGPEGGFTSDEISLAASAGWQPVDLGPRTLRTETAAILLTALLVQSTQQT